MPESAVRWDIRTERRTLGRAEAIRDGCDSERCNSARRPRLRFGSRVHTKQQMRQ